MVSLLVILNWLLPLVYLALLIDYGITFFLRSKVQVRNAGLIPALCVHALFLTLWALRRGQLPLAEVYEILSVLALSTTLVYTLVEYAVRDRRTGMFVFLLVFLFQYTASCALSHVVSLEQMVPSESQSSWARLHIVPALVAYTALAISAVYGLVHLLAQRNLKKHSFGVFFDRLPPLELLGRMTWYALLCGFLFMTIVVLTGPIISSHPAAHAQAAGIDAKVRAKIVIGSIAWIIYAIAVAGKLFAKWPPSRVSTLAVSGFVLVMILFIVSGILSN